MNYVSCKVIYCPWIIKLKIATEFSDLAIGFSDIFSYWWISLIIKLIFLNKNNKQIEGSEKNKCDTMNVTPWAMFRRIK